MADAIPLLNVLNEEDAAIRKLGAPANLEGADEAEQRKKLYQRLNGLGRFALCLSGGGIRSASFALGIIQALAVHPRSADGKYVGQAKDSLLAQFHYLSTVSGGGYIGSWLSLWTRRLGFTRVWAALTGRPGGADVEPHQIEWLRENSNYLTPKLGLTSADFWTAVALYFRNLFLNWFVIVPPVVAVLILLKGYAALGAIVWRDKSGGLVPWFAGLGVVALLISVRFACRYRPSRNSGGIAQVQFFRRDFPFAIGGAMALTLCLASPVFTDVLQHRSAKALMIAGALCFAVVYAVSWVLALPKKRNMKDWVLSTAAGAAYGAALGLGAYFFIEFDGHKQTLFLKDVSSVLVLKDVPSRSLLVVLILGVPWALYSQLFAEMIFTGLASYEDNADNDREWLGRKAGIITAVALIWPVVMYLVFAGSEVATELWANMTEYLAPIGGVAGLVTLLVGKSSRSPNSDQNHGLKTLPTNLILGIAAPLFGGALVILLSALIDKIVLGESLLRRSPLMLPDSSAAEQWIEWGELGIALVAVIGIGLLASWCVNINRFSLHAMYRNRLVRAYLGASTANREMKADPFTNFTTDDNPPLASLWPAKQADATWQPFHVINMALNIVSTKRLAWQERKAESFTATPLHCGSPCLDGAPPAAPGPKPPGPELPPSGAFRRSGLYGGEISLGTAMSISGAAASPNMGYHSSTGVAFLLALFNVRLGWWFGNPGACGDKTYNREGPRWSALPFLYEIFGLTNDTRPFVYLSDGGHFENLGLYEMVRRRCRFIVVSDAGCDPDFVFEDLGNAVRKIAIDLGIDIKFEGLDKLKKRPSGKTKAGESADVGPDMPYHAIGTINYDRVDGGSSKPGVILYVKAGYHGVESAGVRSYALAHKDFPHETTANQWFTESQLESYRALGFEIMDGILTSGGKKCVGDKGPPTLENILQTV